MMKYFMPSNIRELTLLGTYAAAAALACMVGGIFDPGVTLFSYVAVAFTMGIALSIVIVALNKMNVDPWKLQRELIRISPGQRICNNPNLTETSMLYWALQCEELAEMSETLEVVLLRNKHGALAGSERLQMAASLRGVSSTLKAYSLNMRKALSSTLPFTIPLPREQAKSLLDDHCDCMVVNAAFGVVTGLPGARGFLEVNGSNKSKANPDTGLIETDAGGKWIKGPKYYPPNLNNVLDSHWAQLGD